MGEIHIPYVWHSLLRTSVVDSGQWFFKLFENNLLMHLKNNFE